MERPLSDRPPFAAIVADPTPLTELQTDEVGHTTNRAPPLSEKDVEPLFDGVFHVPITLAVTAALFPFNSNSLFPASGNCSATAA